MNRAKEGSTLTITFENLDAENIQLLYDFCTGVYLDGECYAFAVALQQNLGWPIMGLMHGGTIRHALLQRPDGGLFDARGPIKSKDAGRQNLMLIFGEKKFYFTPLPFVPSPN